MNPSRLQRVRDLFEAVVDLDPRRRAELLEAAEADVRREVQELLDLDAAALPAEHATSAEAIAGGIGPGMGLNWLAADMAAGEEDRPTDVVPDRIGRFRIIREIGRGGMGVVYEARQEEPDRRVALKVIEPGFISRGLLRRFRQETRAMAQLRHPGIAQIYEAGASVEGEHGSRPYFVMELVDGPPIDDFATAHNLGHRARLELLARVCDALHHAHQKGVVHRDLKPDNILVHAPAPASGPSGEARFACEPLAADIQPKVLDFGVARLAEEPETDSLRTQQGQIVGTIPYLSPEQALGESAVADIRSDIYSVGVIAYELLSGTLPFDTANRPARAAVRALAETIAPRLTRRVRNLDPDVETIVHTAMARQPERRYQSAADMAADIRRYLESWPIVARPPSRIYLARKFVQRNLALTAVGAGSALLLVVAVVVISSLWLHSLRAEREAVWQRYRSAMSAAGFALQSGEIGSARKHLESTDPRHRGWEYRHFLARVDQSASVVRPSLPPDLRTPVGGAGPFLAVPDERSASGLILISTRQSSSFSLAPGSASAPVEQDPRLALYHAARAGGHGALAFWFTLSSDALHLPPPVGDALGEPVERPLSPRPFEAGERLFSPRLSANGRVLSALRSRGQDLVIADLETGLTRTITLTRGVSGVRTAISGDGSRVAVSNGFLSSLPLRVSIHDTATGAEVAAVTNLPSEVSGMMLDAAGTRVFAAFHDGSLGVWDSAGTAGLGFSLKRAELDRVENLTLSPDQTLLAVGTMDGAVRVFETATMERTLSLIGHEYGVYDVRFLPRAAADANAREGWGGAEKLPAWGGSGGLISTAVDGSVRRWSLDPPPPTPRVISGHSHLVHAMALAETGGFLVTGSWDQSVAFFDLASDRELGRVTAASFVQQLALSPDERWVAAREFGGAVRLFDARRRVEVTTISREMCRIDQPFFDPDSRRLLVAFEPAARQTVWWDLSLQSWVDLPSESLLEFQAAGRAAPAPTLNTRRGLLAVSERREGRDFAVIYDVRTGGEILSVPTRRPATEAVAFTPDGNAVAVADDFHRIQLYDLPSGRNSGTFAGHLREVLALVFSPDQTRLFSADYTGAIWVWDVPSREAITQLRGHPDHVRRLVISRDGRTLYSGGRDGSVRVWEAPPPLADAPAQTPDRAAIP